MKILEGIMQNGPIRIVFFVCLLIFVWYGGASEINAQSIVCLRNCDAVNHLAPRAPDHASHIADSDITANTDQLGEL